MNYKESETVELKEIIVDDVKKEIIAFANGNGGSLYIGIRNDGSILGVDDPDFTIQQLGNMVRDNIRPDLTMFIHYKTIKLEDKNIIMVSIQSGPDKPYYLAKKGIRPEGVYVRHGVSSVPASDAHIRRMIKETDGNHFEEMTSLNQDLTFELAQKEFNLRNIEFGTQQMRSLKVLNHDTFYSNLGLLLSDQCRHTIKCAVFQGTDQMIFKDRREFSGSLLKQMNDVYEFIDFRNQTRATIDKLIRIDVRDYPEAAIREALFNLLVHRDYSFSASAFISIYDDRIEFTSIGGLVPGLEQEDIMLGISACRNQNLANVFYRLHLIEAYGTGILKIMSAYGNCPKKPVIETSKNAFKITLPNRNYIHELKDDYESHSPSMVSPVINQLLDPRDLRVIHFVQENYAVTKKEVARFLNLSPSTTVRILNKLIQCNLLETCGSARSTKYICTQSLAVLNNK